MKTDRKALEKNIGKIYWINLLESSGLHIVVFTLFLLSKGFSMKEFFIIESAFFLVALLMEIPTGMFSDKVSRKWSLVISSLIGIPVTVVIILSNSFYVVLIAMALGGVAGALVSGTDIAILYDTLKGLKKEDMFKKIGGKMRWYGGVSGAIGGIAGGMIAQFDLSYAWWGAVAVSVLSLFVRLSLKEPPFFRESEEESHLLHLGRSFKMSFKGDAAYFVLYAAITWLFFSLGFWLWQPYLKLISIPIFFFGFFYAAERLISGYASKKAHQVEGKIGMRNSLLFIPLILALAFILQSQFVILFGFLFIFLQSVAGGYFGPVLDDYINKRIPSSKRATILSIKNMIYGLLFIIFSPLLGHVVDLYSLQIALLLMGAVLAVVALIFFIVFKKRSKI
ncbi:MFS transporter [Candidatus Woesearchaeota archaeon]|nr:MFS transporter [Candidatus Woesearchaeota archaeon]MBW3018106.1 MFS transporter [Candidatus Woesearchaeota archaeon]